MLICSQQLVYYVSLLLSGVVLVLSTKTTDTHSVPCSLRCTKPRLRQGEIYSKCLQISYSLKTNCSPKEISLRLQNVSFLDLSDNKLTRVPSWIFPFCRNLTILPSVFAANLGTNLYLRLSRSTRSLANNSITDIEPGAFKELRNLKTLNLSFNNLFEWKVEHKKDLQSLNVLDVTGNKVWLPSKQSVLRLKNLRTVRGVTWTKYCKNCLLVRRPALNSTEIHSSSCSGYEGLSSPSVWPWHEQIQYGRALDLIKLGFWPECLCDRVCFIHQFNLPLYRALSDVLLKATFSLYATGSVALVVNITVVLVIVFNRSLRRDIAVVLICNIAVCDVLIAIYSILHEKFNFPKMFIDYLEQTVEGNHCDVMEKRVNIMGPMFTFAVASHVFGSFILTIEKFLKIVFAMKPDIRIGRRGVLLSLFLFCSLSVTFAVLPAFGVGHMTYVFFVFGIPLPTDEQLKVGIAAGVQLVLIIIQLTSLVLYLPIFIVAKRSGANVGIKRDAAIAKKISLLVFTNLIFFTFPIVLGVFAEKLWRNVVIDRFSKWQDLSFTKFQWIIFCFSALPILCVSINSILNPFLLALRHPKIKRELKKIFIRCRTVSSGYFAAFIQHLRCRSVQQENEIEMRDVN